MITVTIRTEVPENRKVELTLPKGVPAGPAEIEVRIKTPGETPNPDNDMHFGPDGRRRAFPPRPIDPKLAREHDLFEQMLPDLMKEYAGKYVALHDGKVIEVGESAVRVLTNAHKKVPGTMHYVRLVTDQPLPLDRVTSHRIVKTEKQ